MLLNYQYSPAHAGILFPQSAYAASADPAEQNRRGPRIETPRQLQFLEGFLDGEWHTVSREDESRLIDGALLDLAGGSRIGRLTTARTSLLSTSFLGGKFAY
ncbi:hypothetical protein [Methylomonas koyamae]|uniref:hypothetical protein n=1 Tax=Methylomonas koyamae TaxID=702114 RepID=UPI0006CFDF21|nr:hypothetical protein [Methylomonas koyamae]